MILAEAWSLRHWMIVVALVTSVGPWARPAAEGARILAIETVAGKSHWNFVSSVLRALTDAGHHVTVFTPITVGDRENYTEVDTSAELPKKLDLDLMTMIKTFGDPFEIQRMGPQLSRSYCDIVLGNRRLNEIMDGDGGDGFDLIMVEPLWTDCLSYLATRLGLPIVYLVPHPLITLLELEHLGHVPSPAAVSDFISQHAVPNTFARRLVDVALLAYGVWSFRFTELLVRYTESKLYNVSKPVPPSVVFLNSYHVIEAPRFFTPTVVPVGGLHLAGSRALPQDILKFIEDSPHGVIYFTFGSVVSMSTLPENIHNAFKEALAQIPQRVLWKYEGEMKDKPENVMTSKWFPQRDILLHPKVKLFISHGGISGVYEAVDAGVPVLGFPLFYDQPRNIDNLVEAGMAISMDLLSVQKDELLTNILEIINNEKYMKNAKIASSIFKDRPMTPEQSVVYWTEYVIRHKGAPHLMSDGLFLTWYQYFLLDVIAVLLVLIFLAFFIVYKGFIQICKYFSKISQNFKIKPE